MNVDDRTYRTLKRAQILTGVVPVGLFLVAHFAINGRAIAGREAFSRTAAALDRVPALAALEWLLIALPLLAHLGLGTVVGLTRQGAFEPARPSPAARLVQRVSGFYLAMYVVFHVWAMRFAPDRLAGRRELFDLMADQLRDPVVLLLHVLAVVSAGAHFGLGLLALPEAFGRDAAEARPAGAIPRVSLVASAVLVALGINALLAFVWAPAQWLAR